MEKLSSVIFQHLHPIDFYNWIRVSKSFRKLLLGHDTLSVWRQAFLECGHPEAMIDFTFRIRHCDTCLFFQSLVSNYSSRQRTVCIAPILADFRNKLVPWSQEAIDIPEIERQVDEIRPLLAAIEKNVPGAQENYEKYKQATRESLHVVFDHLQRPFQQVEAVPDLHTWKDHSLRNIPIEVCIPSFPIWFPSFNFWQDFRRSLPVLEHNLEGVKSRRLLIVRLERQAAVKSQYNAYLRELSPQLWGYFPEFTRVCDVPSIRAYIWSDDESLTPPPDSIKAEFHSFVSDWTTFGKAELSSCITDQMPGYSEKSVPDLMNVATAVVVCAKKEWKGNLDQYPVLIGWEDARLHLDCIAPNNPQFVKSKDAPSFTFSTAGYRAAVHLLGLLGLSPTTTKANVSHAIGCPGRPESLVELTVEDTESVLLHERACLTLPAKSSWSCLHCSDYFQNLGKRKAVVLHVHTVMPRHEEMTTMVHETLTISPFGQEPVEHVDWHQVELWKGGALEMGE
ncbi:hypothetical protein M413DRAFT_8346 [Hebeloma cylindrosporum]|uniref:F-box domain-containing protein n=1 Tax=Hebeloma cylindrosporum TaxID=76867 RepID=A0A0C3CRJ4_HEBCY|nr:hypothetical protein M413DRAFT_8346 [Hebeloma cylindrosporum h7]